MPEVIYLDRDNVIDLALLADGAIADASLITRVLLDLGPGGTVDSSAAGFGAGAAFDVTNTQDIVVGGIAFAAQPFLRMKLGGVAGLLPGAYVATLIIYDPDHPNGLVWTDHLDVTIV